MRTVSTPTRRHWSSCPLTRHSAPRLHVGDAVWCHWSADRPHLFGDAQADLVLVDAITAEAELESSTNP